MTADARLRAALVAGTWAARASRLVGAGAGGTIGGRVTERIAPDALQRLADGRRVVLVSGTNGKSTTTRLTVAAMGGPVATNGGGSNLPRGLIAALAADASPTAVLEVDELHLPRVMRDTRPDVVVALNLSRDQLDRTNEVRRISRLWAEAFRDSDATVVANARDPLVVAAAEQAPAQQWVAPPHGWVDDATVCPACHALVRFDGSGWRCRCGLSEPAAALSVDDEGLQVDGGARVPLSLALPGAVNRGNAAFAAAVAGLSGVAAAEAVARMARVTTVAGRYAEVPLGGRIARLMLAKNPAGWAAALSMVRRDAALAFGINARTADGADTSWLWDVPFERLAGRTVAAFGERATDLAVRLRYAGVDPVLAETADDAATRLPAGNADGRIDVVANYTAFNQVVRAHAA